MNQIFDLTLILALKLILIIGFIVLMKFWLKKQHNIAPIIIYWTLGLFFVLMLSFQIAEWFLMEFYYVENHLTRDKDSVGSLSAIIGIAFYIFIGVKYFKKKNTVK